MPRSSTLGRPATAGLPSFFLLVAVLMATLGAGDARAVVGGTVASSADWPFVVTVTVPIGRCTGSAISPTAVLTAAHCTVDPATGKPFDAAQVTVLGADGQHASSGVRVPASYTTATLQGDASVIFLATPISNTPIAVVPATDATLTRSGALVRLAGLGAEDVLKEASFTVLPDDACVQLQPRPGITFDSLTMYCVAGVLDQSHQCGGDSGGPVVASTVAGSIAPADQRLVGIVSWGSTTCAGINVETRLPNLASWIADQLATPPTGSGPNAASGQPRPRPARRTLARVSLGAAVRDAHSWVFTVGAKHGTDHANVVVRLQRRTPDGYRTFARVPLRLGSNAKLIWGGRFSGARRIRALLPASSRWARSTSRPIVIRPPAQKTAAQAG